MRQRRPERWLRDLDGERSLAHGLRLNEPLKDGIRCFGGTIQRFWKHENSNQTGILRYENVLSQWAEVSNVHLAPGDTRFFQVWFRDSGNGSPCGAKANLSHGIELTLTP